MSRPAFQLPLALVAIVLAVSAAGCLHNRDAGPQRRLTGTCEGACDYYLACKRSDDDSLFGACLVECNEAFSDSNSLRGFESLSCTDAVAYVEGPTGRKPGDPLVGTQ